MTRRSFRGFFASDLHRSLFSGGFVLCVLSVFLVQVQPIAADMMLEGATVIYLYRLSAETGSMQWIMPCVAAIVYSTSFYVDWHTRYHRMMLTRGERRSYIVSKLIVCQLASFVAVFLGMAVFIGFLCVRFPLADYAKGGDVIAWAESSFGQLLLDGKPYLFMLAQCLMRGLGAALWGTAALAVSAFIQNRFVILLSPIILYYVWEYIDAYLARTLFPGYRGVRYLELGITNYLSPIDALFHTAGVLILMLAIWSGVFAFGSGRRLQNG